MSGDARQCQLVLYFNPSLDLNTASLEEKISLCKPDLTFVAILADTFHSSS